MHWIIFLALLIAFEAVADVLAKTWQLRRGWALAAAALAAYLVANSFWLFALKNGSGLARGGIIFSVGSAVLAVAIGLFMFQEAVSPRQMAGIILGIISVLLLVSG